MVYSTTMRYIETYEARRMTHSQESRVSSSQDTVLLREENRTSVSALVNGINACLNGADVSVNNDPLKVEKMAATSNQEGSNEQTPYPWLPNFEEACRSALGCKSIKKLENLLTTFLGYVSEKVKECYTRPNRAAKLRKCINETLMFFHMFYQDVRKPGKRSSYLDLMTELVAMYIDMEIKAACRQKEKAKKITSRVTSALYLLLDKSEDHVLDALLKAKLINHQSKDVCLPMLGKIVNQVTMPLNEMSYVRYLLIFKLFKKVIQTKGKEKQQKSDEEKRINKLAVLKLKPPDNFVEKAKIFTNVLPKIPPKSKKNVTHFFMQAKLNLKSACTAFLKGAKEFQESLYGSTDKELYCSKQLSVYPVNNDKMEGETGFSNDMWASLDLESLVQSSQVKELTSCKKDTPPVKVKEKVKKKKKNKNIVKDKKKDLEKIRKKKLKKNKILGLCGDTISMLEHKVFGSKKGKGEKKKKKKMGIKADLTSSESTDESVSLPETSTIVDSLFKDMEALRKMPILSSESGATGTSMSSEDSQNVVSTGIIQKQDIIDEEMRDISDTSAEPSVSNLQKERPTTTVSTPIPTVSPVSAVCTSVPPPGLPSYTSSHPPPPPPAPAASLEQPTTTTPQGGPPPLYSNIFQTDSPVLSTMHLKRNTDSRSASPVISGSMVSSPLACSSSVSSPRRTTSNRFSGLPAGFSPSRPPPPLPTYPPPIPPPPPPPPPTSSGLHGQKSVSYLSPRPSSSVPLQPPLPQSPAPPLPPLPSTPAPSSSFNLPPMSVPPPFAFLSTFPPPPAPPHPMAHHHHPSLLIPGVMNVSRPAPTSRPPSRPSLPPSPSHLLHSPGGRPSQTPPPTPTLSSCTPPPSTLLPPPIPPTYPHCHTPPQSHTPLSHTQSNSSSLHSNLSVHPSFLHTSTSASVGVTSTAASSTVSSTPSSRVPTSGTHTTGQFPHSGPTPHPVPVSHSSDHSSTCIPSSRHARDTSPSNSATMVRVHGAAHSPSRASATPSPPATLPPPRVATPQTSRSVPTAPPRSAPTPPRSAPTPPPSRSAPTPPPSRSARTPPPSRSAPTPPPSRSAPTPPPLRSALTPPPSRSSLTPPPSRSAPTPPPSRSAAIPPSSRGAAMPSPSRSAATPSSSHSVVTSPPHNASAPSLHPSSTLSHSCASATPSSSIVATGPPSYIVATPQLPRTAATLTPSRTIGEPPPSCTIAAQTLPCITATQSLPGSAATPPPPRSAATPPPPRTTATPPPPRSAATPPPPRSASTPLPPTAGNSSLSCSIPPLSHNFSDNHSRHVLQSGNPSLPMSFHEPIYTDKIKFGEQLKSEDERLLRVIEDSLSKNKSDTNTESKCKLELDTLLPPKKRAKTPQPTIPITHTVATLLPSRAVPTPSACILETPLPQSDTLSSRIAMTLPPSPPQTIPSTPCSLSLPPPCTIFQSPCSPSPPPPQSPSPSSSTCITPAEPSDSPESPPPPDTSLLVSSHTLHEAGSVFSDVSKHSVLSPIECISAPVSHCVSVTSYSPASPDSECADTEVSVTVTEATPVCAPSPVPPLTSAALVLAPPSYLEQPTTTTQAVDSPSKITVIPTALLTASHSRKLGDPDEQSPADLVSASTIPCLSSPVVGAGGVDVGAEVEVQDETEAEVADTLASQVEELTVKQEIGENVCEDMMTCDSAGENLLLTSKNSSLIAPEISIKEEISYPEEQFTPMDTVIAPVAQARDTVIANGSCDFIRPSSSGSEKKCSIASQICKPEMQGNEAIASCSKDQEKVCMDTVSPRPVRDVLVSDIQRSLPKDEDSEAVVYCDSSISGLPLSDEGSSPVNNETLNLNDMEDSEMLDSFTTTQVTVQPAVFSTTNDDIVYDFLDGGTWSGIMLETESPSMEVFNSSDRKSLFDLMIQISGSQIDYSHFGCDRQEIGVPMGQDGIGVGSDENVEGEPMSPDENVDDDDDNDNDVRPTTADKRPPTTVISPNSSIDNESVLSSPLQPRNVYSTGSSLYSSENDSLESRKSRVSLLAHQSENIKSSGLGSVVIPHSTTTKQGRVNSTRCYTYVQQTLQTSNCERDDSSAEESPIKEVPKSGEEIPRRTIQQHAINSFANVEVKLQQLRESDTRGFPDVVLDAHKADKAGGQRSQETSKAAQRGGRRGKPRGGSKGTRGSASSKPVTRATPERGKGKGRGDGSSSSSSTGTGRGRGRGRGKGKGRGSNSTQRGRGGRQSTANDFNPPCTRSVTAKVSF